MSHTPGPWVIGRHCSTNIFNMEGRSIASSGGYQSNVEITLMENEANAKLIAAAPDLLEALDLLCGAANRLYSDGSAEVLTTAVNLDKAEQAIAKARGEL